MPLSQIKLDVVSEDDQVVAETGEQGPKFGLCASNLTASVLGTKAPTVEPRIEVSNQRYAQLGRILSSCDNIYIPQPLSQVFHMGDSIPFNLVGLTSEQVQQFLQKTRERGVNIAISECADNARLLLDFNLDKTTLIGYLIKEELYRIISRERTDDFRVPVANEFEDASEIVSLYDMWASNYDEDHEQNGWKMLLNYVAYTLLSYLSPDDRILDIGCGTGLFGRELYAYNFSNLQGVDISQASLEISHTHNIYQGLHEMAVGPSMAFEDSSFDALVSTGVFTRKQVPLGALDELIRILKPGGMLALVIRVEDDGYYYKPLQDYCTQHLLSEKLKVSISVQQTSNHELVVLQKNKESNSS